MVVMTGGARYRRRAGTIRHANDKTSRSCRHPFVVSVRKTRCEFLRGFEEAVEMSR